MDALIRRRASAKAQMTNLEKFLEAIIKEEYLNSEIEALNVRLERLEHYASLFEETHQKILEEIDENEVQTAEKIRENFEEQYVRIKSGFKKAIAVTQSRVVYQPSSNSNADQVENSIRALADHQGSMATLIERLANSRLNEGSSNNNIKLPNIDLPTFGGNYREWVSYRDLFKSLVHDNVKLSLVQKFQYLKTSLRGDALAVVKHLAVTDANYQAAWDGLHVRFDKEKLIIEAHIKTIMEQVSLNQTSLSGLKGLFNITTESIQSLKSLEAPVEHWDYWLNYVILSKLDLDSKQLWARKTATNDKPTFDELLAFIQERLFELDSIQVSSKNTVVNRIKKVHAISVQNCQKCSRSHELFKCAEFKALSTYDRKAFVGKSGLCFICLSNNHSAKNCSSSLCSTCGGRHHDLLHFPIQTSANNVQGMQNIETQRAGGVKSSDDKQSVKIHLAAQKKNHVLLPTAVVLVRDSMGTMRSCRALLDSGSQTILITEKCVQKLGLKRKNARLMISGISPNTSTANYSRGEVSLNISSRALNKNYETSALILTEITSRLPLEEINMSVHPAIKTVDLADPNFYKSSKVDLLIGADIVLASLKDGEIISKNQIIRNTDFGWIVGGRVEVDSPKTLVHLNITDIDRSLRMFWEIEEAPLVNATVDEDSPAERHYQETHQRLDDGRYMVRLPFIKDPSELGSSKEMAMSRLRSIERKFARSDNIREEYNKFMKEYLYMNHMKEIEEFSERFNCERRCYLPHHSVLKPDSATTKLRVVFDASCKTTSGVSLNQLLMVGPVIQPELVKLLLKFRLHRIGLCADIAKMYRQILVHPEDCKFQTILWRFGSEQELRCYELLTVTYGTPPASFLATRTLKQLAIDDGDKFPSVKEMLIKNFYMDDLIMGADSSQEAIELVDNIKQLLSGGGFDIRKWASNDTELMQKLANTEVSCAVAFSDAEAEFIKTLGLFWNPSNDILSFQLRLNADFTGTKIEMLSEISRIFDPLGLIAPCVVCAKIMFQRLWLRDVGWDTVLPEPIYSQWIKLRAELHDIENIEIPRCIAVKGDKLELYGFADASDMAYAAVIYLRATQVNGKIDVNIIQAKTKVAPLQQISLPRLELCAAHLLSKLMSSVRTTLEVDEENCFMYSDSMTVLRWLAETPRKWTTFVANRAADIRYRLPDVKWRYIPSSKNPADCASRGLSPLELKEYNLWWHGPNILREQKIDEQENSFDVEIEVPEQRKTTLVAIIANRNNDFNLLYKYSSYRRMIRVTAMRLRFIRNLKSKREDRSIGPLKVDELKSAAEYWILQAQQTDFHEEIATCSRKGPLQRRSKLASLNPFLDDRGILRVGGRLAESQLSYCVKYPIILSSSHQLTKLIVAETHSKYFHAGLQLMQTILSQKYHIINSRKLLKQEVRKCVKCVRYRAITQRQQMGNLPEYRTEPGRPFLYVGIDYAGPFMVRPWKGRGCKQHKAYVALFICMMTKAVHLELVTELLTEAFIASFKRFSARRGLSKRIYSDNATNFIGAKRLLDDLQGFLSSSDFRDVIIKYLHNDGIDWRFIPPSSPNFGGIWEAAVKSMKFHLKREVGNMSLTIEEMQTLLCQVEAVLNSRPLTPVNDTGLEALTPAHFLVGGNLLSVPEVDITNVNINRLTRWELVQRLHQNLWKRWLKEYHVTLRQRKKWQKPTPNLKIGDLVIVHEDNTPPACWPLSRVVNVHPGKDGLVRVLTLQGRRGTFKRPISKVALLPITTEESEQEIHGGRYVADKAAKE